MKLNDIKAQKGSRHTKKTLGRGIGSGLGKTSGRGHKGQGSRKSGNVRIGFEGGQTPLYRRIPKRGFTNFTKKDFLIINVGLLNALEIEGEITLEILVEAGVIKAPKNNQYLKVLGEGDVTKPLVVKASAFTKQAKEKIEAANGQAIVI